MTIVCATRFSEESTHAVNAAAALARRHSEPLHLVHVMPPSVMRAVSERMAEAARAALEVEVLRFREMGVKVTAEILVGRVEEELARCCALKNARMLVVGDTAKAAGNILAGSLDKLAYTAEVPLVIVRDARPFEAWATSSAPLKVMLAFDHTASSAVARDWLVRLAEYGPIELSVGHLYWPIEEYERRGLARPPSDEGHVGLIARIKGELQREFGNLPSNVKVHIRAEMGVGQIADHLLELAGEEQVDLVLLGTHRKRALGRLWSVSHHIMLQAPMAVACVPSTVSVPHLARAPRWTTAMAVADFSEASNRVVAWAATLLKAGGTLHVAHVSPEPLTPEREKQLLQRLAASLPPNIEKMGVKALVHVFQGVPEKVIAEHAEKLNVDMLCVGARSIPGFEKAEAGVVAPAVLEQWRMVQTLLEVTGKPVLLAPPLVA
jgi:nucleotide-binding universal stress UspA family protein